MRYYKIALWKAYFEKGYSFLSYPKWVLAIFGVGQVVNKNYWSIVLYAFIFAFGCLLVGKWCYWSGFTSAELEVNNKINPFVKEMRNSKIFKGE